MIHDTFPFDWATRDKQVLQIKAIYLISQSGPVLSRNWKPAFTKHVSSKHTAFFQRCNNVVDVYTTLHKRKTTLRA